MTCASERPEDFAISYPKSAEIGAPALPKLLRGETSMRSLPAALRRFAARLHTVGTLAAPPDSER